MDRLAEIQAILSDDAQRAALSDEKLAELESELLSLFDDIRQGKIEGVVRNDVTKLREVSEAAKGIRNEAGVRIAAAETAAQEERDREAEAERIAAELMPPKVETPAEEVPAEPVAEIAPESVAEVAPEPAAEPEVPVAAAPVLEPVGASAIPAAAPAPQASLATVGANVPAASQPAPRIENTKPRWEVGRGEFVEWPELVDRIMEANESFGDDYYGPEQKVRVGRIRREYAPERDLSEPGMNARTIEQRLGAVLDDAWAPDKWADQALVASGGFCAPPAVAYDFPVISQAGRPVWDGYLPKFRADRGALTFMTPFGISSIVTSTGQGAGSALSVWTNTIDTTPGGTTKPKQTIACPAQQTVTLQAVVQQIQIGNFLGRALPELVSKFMTEVNSAHARLGESLNLTDIDGASNAMTVAKLIGATGDLVMSVRQAAARYRNNQRMAPDSRLRVLIPAWVIDFIAADVAQRHAGDGLDIFTVNEGWVRALFNNMNVNVTFYQDAGANATQQLGPQGPTDIRNWPLTVVWYLFHEGAFLGLDGGTLDVGLVRDSTLNGTNNYQIFSESFEKVAFRGLESQKITQTICPTGEGVTDHAALSCSAS